MQPLGYFNINNTNAKLESPTEKQAIAIIGACYESIKYGTDAIQKDLKSCKGDTNQLWVGYKEVIPAKLYKQYAGPILTQPVQLLQWASQAIVF